MHAVHRDQITWPLYLGTRCAADKKARKWVLYYYGANGGGRVCKRGKRIAKSVPTSLQGFAFAFAVSTAFSGSTYTQRRTIMHPTIV